MEAINMQSTKQVRYCGIDVAKNTLQVYFEGKTFAVPNALRGFEMLAEKVPEGLFVVEATGGYEDAWVDFCFQHQRNICVVNPTRIRRFAQAKGVEAKTDAIDAQMIADYASHLNPRPIDERYFQRKALRELLSRRDDLIALINAEKCRLDMARHPITRETIRATLQVLEDQKRCLEKTIAAEIAHLKEINERLCQIKGIGKINAATILAFLPELGTLTDKQAAALAGLAPYDRQSGEHRGHGFIRGGRGNIRVKLYMAAVCASIHNPILRAFYQRLRNNGKPAKVAHTAVMRKLIVLMNKLLKNPDFQLA